VETSTLTAVIVPDDPVAIDWRRVRRAGGRIVVVVTIAFGVFLLLREARTLGLALTSLSHANPIGLVLTGVLGAATYLAAAIALIAASGEPLPLGRTAAVQLAAAATNRIAPAGLGAMATNLRYLEGSGATTSEAATAIGITSVASVAVHTVATVIVLAAVRRSFGAPVGVMPRLPWPAVALASLAVGAIAIFAARRFGPRARIALRESWATIRSLCADPRRLARLFVGTIGVTLGHGLAFAAAVTACGVHLSVVSLLAVFLGGAAVASVAPTPGGLGALEGALVAGLTTLGAPVAPAVAGVLAFRLITYWLPVVPGAVALAVLRRDVLAHVPSGGIDRNEQGEHWPRAGSIEHEATTLGLRERPCQRQSDPVPFAGTPLERRSDVADAGALVGNVDHDRTRSAARVNSHGSGAVLVRVPEHHLEYLANR
jgi:undecaprenyl-diphosphatase